MFYSEEDGTLPRICEMSVKQKSVQSKSTTELTPIKETDSIEEEDDEPD